MVGGAVFMAPWEPNKDELPGQRAATPCNATSTRPKEPLQRRAQGNSRACTHAKTIDY